MIVKLSRTIKVLIKIKLRKTSTLDGTRDDIIYTPNPLQTKIISRLTCPQETWALKSSRLSSHSSLYKGQWQKQSRIQIITDFRYKYVSLKQACYLLFDDTQD